MEKRLAVLTFLVLLPFVASPGAFAGPILTQRFVTPFETFTLFGAGVQVNQYQTHGVMTPVENTFTHPHMPITVPAAPLTMNSVYHLSGVTITAYSSAQTTSKVEAMDTDMFSDMATHADFSVQFDFWAPAGFDQSSNQPYLSTWSFGVSCGFCNTNPNLMSDDDVFDMLVRQYAFRTNVVGYAPSIIDWLSTDQPIPALYRPTVSAPIEIDLSHTDWLRMTYNADDTSNWSSTGVNYWRGSLETTYYYTLDEPAPVPEVPEPGTMLLVASGLAVLARLGRRRTP